MADKLTEIKSTIDYIFSAGRRERKGKENGWRKGSRRGGRVKWTTSGIVKRWRRKQPPKNPTKHCSVRKKNTPERVHLRQRASGVLILLPCRTLAC